MARNPYERIHRIEEMAVPDRDAFVYSPEILRRAFFEGEAAPINTVLRRFEKAGVPQERRERYRLAVEAFFQNPSKVTTGEGFDFRPQEHHFGPEIQFQEEVPVFLDVLRGTPLKPRLTKECGLLTPLAIDGKQVLKRYLSAERSDLRPTPEEVLLAQLNRLAYAFHEPIHAFQGFAAGDQMNNLLRQVDGQDIADRAKQLEYLNSPVFKAEFQLPISMELAKTASVGLPDDRNDPGEEGSLFTGGTFEASMDFLSQEAIGCYVRQQPLLLLWSHNTLSSLVEGLREVQRALSTGSSQYTATDLMNVTERLHTAIGFVAPVYFSVFQTSVEGHEYLTDLPSTTTVLGRHLSGSIAHVPPFSRCEIETVYDECRLLMGPANTRRGTWSFPCSGKTYQFGILPDQGEAIFPITDRGIEKAALLVAAAAKKSWPQAEIEEQFNKLDHVFKWFVEQHFSRDDFDLALSEIAAGWKKRLEIDFTIEDLQELFGISVYLYPKISHEYPKQFLIRKAFIEALERTGEPTDYLFSPLLTENEHSVRGIELLLGTIRQEPGSDSYHLRSDQEVLEDRQLGIFSLDVPALPAAEQRQLAHWLQNLRSYRERGLSHGSEKALLGRMADWKRLQLSRQRLEAA